MIFYFIIIKNIIQNNSEERLNIHTPSISEYHDGFTSDPEVKDIRVEDNTCIY